MLVDSACPEHVARHTRLRYARWRRRRSPLSGGALTRSKLTATRTSCRPTRSTRTRTRSTAGAVSVRGPARSPASPGSATSYTLVLDEHGLLAPDISLLPADDARCTPCTARRPLSARARFPYTFRVTETRTEKDPLGPLEVPADAYFGVQTQRAIHNFPISGRRPDIALVRAAVQVKKAAARANGQTGRLSDDIADAIIQAADEILGLAAIETEALQATLIDNFRVDPFQAGAGVSHNMNTNEVLANRAIEILGGQGVGSGQRGDYSVVNPNDHVNMAQSTNDTFPTAMRVATLDRVRELLPVLDELAEAFAERGARLRRRAQVAAARTCRTRCRSGWARSSPPTR